MWQIFENFEKKVSRYSSVFGQFWYLLTFVFRLMVVVALGGSVYGDEKGSFTCITSLPACSDICYNTYARISQMRFWSFQLIAVTFPAVLFHFYSNYIQGEVEKLKIEQEELKKTMMSNQDKDSNNMIKSYDWNHHRYKQEKRERKLGKVSMKKVFNEGSLLTVPVTNKIKVGYYISVVGRMIIEAIFIYYGYVLYNYQDNNCMKNPDSFNCPVQGWYNFLWMTVPTQFICDSPTVRSACAQHYLMDDYGKQYGHIVCYMSRPFEKSIFLRYMQILANVCFLLCAFEIIYIPIREIKSHKKRSQRKAERNRAMKSELDVEGNDNYHPNTHSMRFVDRRLPTEMKLVPTDDMRSIHKSSIPSPHLVSLRSNMTSSTTSSSSSSAFNDGDVTMRSSRHHRRHHYDDHCDVTCSRYDTESKEKSSHHSQQQQLERERHQHQQQQKNAANTTTAATTAATARSTQQNGAASKLQPHVGTREHKPPPSYF